MSKVTTSKATVKEGVDKAPSDAVLDLTNAITVRFNASVMVNGTQVQVGQKVRLAKETGLRFVASAYAVVID